MLEVIPVRHGNHGGNNASDGGNPNVAKATAMCVLFVCSLTLGLIPIKLTKWLMKKNKTKGPPDSNTYVQMLLGEFGSNNGTHLSVIFVLNWQPVTFLILSLACQTR